VDWFTLGSRQRLGGGVHTGGSWPHFFFWHWRALEPWKPDAVTNPRVGKVAPALGHNLACRTTFLLGHKAGWMMDIGVRIVGQFSTGSRVLRPRTATRPRSSSGEVFGVRWRPHIWQGEGPGHTTKRIAMPTACEPFRIPAKQNSAQQATATHLASKIHRGLELRVIGPPQRAPKRSERTMTDMHAYARLGSRESYDSTRSNRTLRPFGTGPGSSRLR